VFGAAVVPAPAVPVREPVEFGFSNKKSGNAAIVAKSTTINLHLSIMGFVSSTLPPIGCCSRLDNYTVEASFLACKSGIRRG
jgi:hypothetical protein